ncbi:unnamed protein product, partial [Thlaspi arvense]
RRNYTRDQSSAPCADQNQGNPPLIEQRRNPPLSKVHCTRDILGDSDQDGVTFVQVTVLEYYSSNNLRISWPKGASTKVRLEVTGKKAKNATFVSWTEAGKIAKEIVKVEKRRIVKSTLCNERSSRSDCMFILDVLTVGGRLMLVDMVGSQNIDQAGQTGFEEKMQTAKINQENILELTLLKMTSQDSNALMCMPGSKGNAQDSLHSRVWGKSKVHNEDISELNEGTVSSVAPREYFDGTYKLLSIEIDNDRCYCSGPVVMRDMIVGSNKKLWNCIIPTPVIKYFLNGLEERHIGFSLLDIRYQTLEDAQLRRHFKMSHDMTGVLITEIDPLSNAFKVLKKHDVILAIEDLPVDNDRTVHFQRKEYLSLNHLVSMKKPGEVASLKILRNGKEHAYNVSLNFTVLMILAGALLEKQIVFICSNLGLLAASVLSIIPVICPFRWQSFLMPVLPDDMLESLDAPVPYIVSL